MARATVRPFTAGKAAELAAVVAITDELLWLLGLWVAEGSPPPIGRRGLREPERRRRVARPGDEGPRTRSRRACRARSRFGRSLAGAVRPQHTARRPMEHLRIRRYRKRIPGWILSLPSAVEMVHRGLPRGRRCPLWCPLRAAGCTPVQHGLRGVEGRPHRSRWLGSASARASGGTRRCSSGGPAIAAVRTGA